MSNVTLRWANRDDCAHIAKLFQIAGGGTADYIWSLIGPPGRPLLEIGEERYARQNAAFSYENCVMAEIGGEVAGMMHVFEMLEPAETNGEDIDPVLRPYDELELPHTYYISGIAFYPEHRGKGIGSRLLDLAAEIARDRNLNGVSLIAFEQNKAAVRLYQRKGFQTTDRRTVVPHEMILYSGDALLMVKR